MNENETAPTFRVFDIPLELSAIVTEKILNAELGTDRYISAVAPIPGALRVVARVKADKVRLPDEDQAIAFVHAHPDLSQARTVAMLKANGMHRTTSWVSQRRYDIEAEHKVERDRGSKT